MCVCVLSHVWLSVAPWTIALQAPPSMGFPRQEYWSGLPFPPPGDLPDTGIEPRSLVSLALAGGSLSPEPSWNRFYIICHNLKKYPNQIKSASERMLSEAQVADNWPTFRVRSTLNIHGKDWCWSWSSNTLATWCEAPTHWKKPWCWERLRTREGSNRGWDGWIASLTQWTWVWANPGR